MPKRSVSMDIWLDEYLEKVSKDYSYFTFSGASSLLISVGLIHLATTSKACKKLCNSEGIDKLLEKYYGADKSYPSHEVKSVISKIHHLARNCSECLEANRFSKSTTKEKVA